MKTTFPQINKKYLDCSRIVWKCASIQIMGETRTALFINKNMGVFYVPLEEWKYLKEMFKEEKDGKSNNY